MKRFIIFASLIALCCPLVRAADSGLPDAPIGSEVAFVSGISKDLNARFPTPSAAERLGYFRYTNEDRFGAISYANLRWQSSDPQHPSQLWYSVNGKLLGADFSRLRSTSKTPPQVWGVNPRRWTTFRAHIHYVLVGRDLTETYADTSVAKFVAAGGNRDQPRAAPLVKLGIAKTEESVKRVFLFPAIWDLEVWVAPNPSGAFAKANPRQKPSSHATDEDA